MWNWDACLQYSTSVFKDLYWPNQILHSLCCVLIPDKSATPSGAWLLCTFDLITRLGRAGWAAPWQYRTLLTSDNYYHQHSGHSEHFIQTKITSRKLLTRADRSHTGRAGKVWDGISGDINNQFWNNEYARWSGAWLGLGNRVWNEV